MESPVENIELRLKIFDMTALEDGSTSDDSGAGQVLHHKTPPDYHNVTKEQQSIVTNVVMNIDKQILAFVDGGGGTGKTAMLRELSKQLLELGYFQANTWAAHLPNGKTIDWFFEPHKQEVESTGMSTNLRRDKLKLVVVNEASLLQCEQLELLHQELKSMYKTDKMFGGVSILLLGDFLQLPPVSGGSGGSLYSVMFETRYGKVTGTQNPTSALFSAFEWIEMTKSDRPS